MRHNTIVIGFAFLFMAGMNVLLAQHAGGHASGGHASGGHSGFSSGFHARSVSPATTPSVLSQRNPLPGQHIYPTPFELQPQHSGIIGINPGVLSYPYGTYPYGSYGRGYNRGSRAGYGYPYAYGLYPPYYISTFDDNDNFENSPGYYDQGQSESAQTAQVTANLLGQEINQLSAEVDALRNQRDAGPYPPYANGPARPPYNAPPAVQQDETPSSPPVVLVLNDGKQLQLGNYAVMGQNFWDFSVQPAKKIPLSSININASKAATEAKGAEFPEIG